MTIRIITVRINTELDIVCARQRARQIAIFCGFSSRDQVRIATSVSELARNIFNYAGEGKIHFTVEGETSPQVLTIILEDNGPGIADLELILSGSYKSPTGMGKGLLGARRLMDRCEIKSAANLGTTIILQKLFPRGAPLLTPRLCVDLLPQLDTSADDITMAEVQQQNQELLGALAELKVRQEDLLQLTRELEDTNRGVVALYAELEEKADHLRRADTLKSRFLSNMSHEFRTPLSSIRALAKLLIERVDGDLSPEQEKQVIYIQQSAVDLTELVNDLLDLVKIEAGKVDVHPHQFSIAEMFSALRGMLRPLLVSESLTLNFIEPDIAIELFTDEAKLSQILRNFISNALKFTEKGSINVSAQFIPEQAMVKFSVADTGLGIAAGDLRLIFEEFSQIENSLQSRVKGTGLGLPLCRNLANLLNGEVEVESELGRGSTFSVTIPQHFFCQEVILEAPVPEQAVPDDRLPVLVLEDHPAERLLYEKFLLGSEFRMVAARTVREAADLWPAVNPVAVVMDIMLYGQDAWPWLAELKNDPLRRGVPIIVATEIEDRRKGLALGADAYFVKPLFKYQLLTALRTLIAGGICLDGNIAAPDATVLDNP